MKGKEKFLGIDIGSISIGVALLSADKKVLKHDYVFHEGDVKNKLLELLNNFDPSEIKGFAFTSSCPDIFKAGKKYDSKVSIITSAKYFHEKLGGVLIVGGERFGLATFDEKGNYKNYRSNTSCAAGTGSFLDQQARRLNLPDIGSTSTKAAIVDEYENVLVGLYTRTSGRPVEAVQAIFEAIDSICSDCSCDFNFMGAGTTGSGRKFMSRWFKHIGLFCFKIWISR